MKFVRKTPIIVLFLLVSLIVFSVQYTFFDWSLFKQELIIELTSPEGTYTINAYVYNGGATVNYSVLGELVF
ncbi:hypothetical protein H1D32_21035 [Anaerobacillus sp. CMMVII]|uniref:DUF5412 domain-containing protein n=1 Tax=Anaerobacillus sp. CMMVII TaxID=2755588 RepID=UPI0021B72A6C|nr:DUF5412 domain-containing protein [Anaerobacillus sp. CMMVII]MCT8139964.1 hypothetical protein [Anaerobacillus sp. CMMVII]